MCSFQHDTVQDKNSAYIVLPIIGYTTGWLYIAYKPSQERMEAAMDLMDGNYYFPLIG